MLKKIISLRTPALFIVRVEIRCALSYLKHELCVVVARLFSSLGLLQGILERLSVCPQADVPQDFGSNYR